MMEELTGAEVNKIARGEYVPRKSKLSQSDAQKVMVPAKAAKRQRGAMNKGERKYADELASRFRAGTIQWWEFEAVKVRLADNTFITPDFAVIADDGYLEFHDVKGRKGKGYWCEEDAKIKLKLLAERFPARVKIVWPNEGGIWQSETV